MNTRKVILYISMTLDGFIATKDDDISWLDSLQIEGEDYGYHTFTSEVDTYIVGRKTYDKVIDLIDTFPQKNQFDCYVITRNKKLDAENITFYTSDVEELINDLKTKDGKNIYCDGGGEIVQLLMKKDLIDEYIISIAPTILGNGKRLFQGIDNPINIKLMESKTYDSGLVQVKYQRIRN